jgi:hypothetical protein
VSGAGLATNEIRRCRCGHSAAAHEHYRSGTECATCPAGACNSFRRAPIWLYLREVSRQLMRMRARRSHHGWAAHPPHKP